MQKLTVKQQRFIDEYIISGNATQAAIKAGYSKKTARFVGAENLTKPNIKNLIDEQLKKLHDEKVVDQEEIMEFLSAVNRGEVTESVATNKGVFDDVPVGVHERIKAAELLGKRYAMWTENRNINATVGPVQIVDDIPKDDVDG